MSKKFTDEQIAEYKQAFDLFDKDKSGSISVKELGTVIRSLNINVTDEELKDLVGDVDTNQNGLIEFNEFLELMAKGNSETNSEEALRLAFKVFDVNGDGKISFAELKQALGKLGEKNDDETVNQMLKEADLNGDGEIGFEEFKKMMENI